MINTAASWEVQQSTTSSMNMNQEQKKPATNATYLAALQACTQHVITLVTVGKGMGRHVCACHDVLKATQGPSN
jgi:hypothetical protein